MKAVIYTKYGPPDVLQLKDIQKPAPNDNEVLIKVHATSVNRTDSATIRAIPFFARIITGLFKPKKHTPGTEFAGEIEVLGKSVSSFNIGERVFGFDYEGLESQAQYISVKEDSIITMPDGISYKQAAISFEGAHYAYNFINKVDIKKGQNVLVNGATGAIGSAAVQLLKYFEVNVTAVCATKNIELVKSLGAKRVIDYTKENFTKDEQRYDFVFDTVGKSSFFKCKHLLQTGGAYISSDLGYMAQNLYLPLITLIIKPLNDNKIAIFPDPKDIKGTMILIKSLIEQGKFKAVTDREFPLEQIVEAYKYVEKGQKIGNVVITIEHNE